MSADLGLDSLLRSLRHAGLRVGVTEVVRLREVFAREPALAEEDEAARSRFASLLRAVLVKSTADRLLFDRVLAAWLTVAEQEVRLRGEKPAEPMPLPGGRRRRRFPFWRLAAVLLVLAMAVAVDRDARVLSKTGPQTVEEETEAPPREEAPQPWPEEASLDEVRKRTFRTWVPELTVIPGDRVWTGWPALGLGVLALLVTGVLWVLLRRRRWVPEAAPEPQRRGPPRVFLSPPPLPGPQLLDAREQEALVWGIGRFLIDEPTRRLDLTATVRATAKAAGLPQLHFHRASQYREVWLWLDETAEDPALARLAHEVETVLAAHGLPVERASFRGLPFELFGFGGHVFAPAEVDERREVARVAVLTDGRVLSRQYSADDRRTRIDALLRGISHWPQLAFIDFSDGDGGLAEIVARYGIEVLPPHRLVSFLAGGTAGLPQAGNRPASPPAGAEAAWAAACALPPSPVDEATALLLRRQLGLPVSPWALRALQAEAPGPPGRLQWRPLDRAQRVNWMRESEAQSGEKGRVAPGSLLGRALDFWEEIYEADLKRREAEDSAVPWDGTPAQQHLVMERELLRLWRDPGGATRKLYALHQGGLRETIRAQLGVLAPAGRGEEGVIQLPWSWEQRSATERLMLREMSLGGGLPPVRLRRPGRFWLGLTACMGLGIGALVMASTSGMNHPEDQPLVDLGKEMPGDAWFQRWGTEVVGWRVEVGTRKVVKAIVLEDAGSVSVQWSQKDQPCVETLDNQTEIWRCGRRGAFTAQLPQPTKRSVVIIELRRKTDGADRLAAALLDSRSADLVLLKAGWVRDDIAGIGSGLKDQQILIISETLPPWMVVEEQKVAGGTAWLWASSRGALADALEFEGTRTATQVWPDVDWKQGDGSDIWLHGLGTGCQPREYEEKGDGLRGVVSGYVPHGLRRRR